MGRYALTFASSRQTRKADMRAIIPATGFSALRAYALSRSHIIALTVLALSLVCVGVNFVSLLRILVSPEYFLPCF